ncbi:hypothetical protein V1478_017449 [Vespula squamosa]|uniref:Uncharacterized protein n=1 Tax=Vespula squamosa TaxID=30214 RepID=A0ABD1ZWY0_VESSQ
MSINKSKLRLKLTDEHLQALIIKNTLGTSALRSAFVILILSWCVCGQGQRSHRLTSWTQPENKR